MPNPAVSFTGVTKKGPRLEVSGDYFFTGTGSVKVFATLINKDGTTLGPFERAITTPGKFSYAPELGEGEWKVRITVTPQNGVDQPGVVEMDNYVKFSLAVGRAVMPGLGGEPGVSTRSVAASMNESLRLLYAAALQSGANGNKRSAAATAVIDRFGVKPVLRIFRNSEEIVRVNYNGALIKKTENVNDITLATPAITDVTVFKTADLTAGEWRFALQGYGSGQLAEIVGSVGGPGSNKKMVLSESPTPEAGFQSAFMFVLPRAADGLV